MTKKPITIDKAIQLILFLTPEDARHLLQSYFPRDYISIEIDLEGNTIIRIGSQIRRIAAQRVR